MVSGFVSTPRLRKKQTKVRMSDFSPANIWLQILQRNGREIAGKQGEKTPQGWVTRTQSSWDG